MWKHNVLKEAAHACSCNLTAYVEAVLLHKTARCLVLFSQAVKPILKLRVKQKFFYHYFSILLKGAGGRMDVDLIPCNLSFSLKFGFIALETRNLLSCQLLGSRLYLGDKPAGDYRCGWAVWPCNFCLLPHHNLS